MFFAKQKTFFSCNDLLCMRVITQLEYRIMFAANKTSQNTRLTNLLLTELVVLNYRHIS